MIICCHDQVYEHHCIQKLPGSVRRLRDAAVYMVNNVDAVQWALEFYGFRDISIKVLSCLCRDLPLG